MIGFFVRLFGVLVFCGVLYWAGMPAYSLANNIGNAMLKSGWGSTVEAQNRKMPAFLLGCQLKPKCQTAFNKAFSSRFDRTPLYGVGGSVVFLMAIFIFTTPRRRQKYNARWANAGDFVGRNFSNTSKSLELGLQLAYLWKTYPDVVKNRYGHLQIMDWGRWEGKAGGNVVSVVPTKKRKELGHVLVVGPTRCGKGLGITQNLLCFKGSVAVNDPKGENFKRTAAWRKQMGQDVRVIDPRGRGDRFDPFAELSRKPETLKMACKLIADPEADGGESIFAERGSSALYAGMRAAIVAGQPILAHLRELTREGLPGFVAALASSPDSEVRQNLTDFLGKAPDTFDPETAMGDRFLSSCWSTITARLFPLFSPGILASASASDFLAEDLLMKPTSLYLCFAETDLSFTKTYLQLVWLSITSSLIEVGDRLMGDTPQRVLFGLDEAGVVPIPRLPDLLATIAGRGMSAMIYVQDESQLEAAYGEEGAHTIVTNCDAQVFYAPRDLMTQKTLSQRCGNINLAVLHRQRSGGVINQRWESDHRELLTPDEARQLNEENVIVIYGNKFPLLGRRLNFTKHPYWKKAKEMPPLEVKELLLQSKIEPQAMVNKDVPFAFPT
jgi:type IV secretion system protein VirD4